MHTIIIDTNMFLIPGTMNVDIFSEIQRICDFAYTLCVLEKTITELEGVMHHAPTGAEKKAAKLGLAIIQRHIALSSLHLLRSDHNVDDALVEFVETDHAIVATLDGELKKRVIAAGGRVITLRQKKYLVIE